MTKHNIKSIHNNQVDKATERKVRSAMSQLVLDSPFFSLLLLQQKMIYTTDVPTMATDSKHIFINPLFVAELNKQEIVGVLVHELYHTIFFHITRRGNRDPKLFNIAGDYAINQIVKEEGFTLPSDHLDDPKYHGMTADKIYNLLETEPPPEEFLVDFPSDILYQDHLSESDKKEIEQETKINITKAMTAAGDETPDSVKTLIKEAIKEKVDWRTLLREFIQVALGHDEATWKRPNRTYIHKNLYLPSYEGKTMPSIAIMIDTSGSIYGNMDLFKAFSGEINKIVEDFVPEQVDIFYVDTRIHRHDTFDEGEEPTYEVAGGGGTNFRSAWPEIEKVEPACIIAFTDAWATFPQHSSIDTLWMVYENTHAEVPFGKVVYVEED